ncbi:alpha/beta hydrolase [Adhaeribacter radiodurans]|uniref:Alpha/beta hydrolase n=1 Tax=Adhaeribacter radiodurans TaxID=2745197 RepID=A0A7L7LA99_9BACT|nr:alpha/beta hydrolase [Adhaeribacter radiodurans]QMU29667.1 alpha/beta hydrolase [Adhaeribacter radiodurans]
MKQQVLFIQGGGDEGYEEDALLVVSLQTALGATYQVHYPRMPSNKALPDFGWLQQIHQEIMLLPNQIILVAHSLGASMLLKYLSEKQAPKNIAGIFLLATPFWSGDENWVQGLKLPDDFPGKLPDKITAFLYHCRDDDVVPFEQLARYQQLLPQAAARSIESGGHQFNHDLSRVAADIKSL